MESIVELTPGTFAEERRAEESAEITSVVGMCVALAAWAMMFAPLLFVYFGLRAQQPVWPPLGLPALPLGLPVVNTLVIGLSSITLTVALRHFRPRQFRQSAQAQADAARHSEVTLRPGLWFSVTLALGALFVVLQCVLWRSLWLQGITTKTGVLGTVFYGLTTIHAVHVAAGVAVLAYLAWAGLGGRVKKPLSASRLRLLGMFWHFVGAVWAVMFVSLFVY